MCPGAAAVRLLESGCGCRPSFRGRFGAFRRPMIKQELERLISDAVRKAQDAGDLPAPAGPGGPRARPPRPEHGPYPPSLALRLSRSARMSPLEMAKVIAAHVEVDEALASANVAPPGFVNFRLAP